MSTRGEKARALEALYKEENESSYQERYNKNINDARIEYERSLPKKNKRLQEIEEEAKKLQKENFIRTFKIANLDYELYGREAQFRVWEYIAAATAVLFLVVILTRG